MPLSANRLAIGVDIGGTNIKMGIIDGSGRMVKFDSRPISRNQDGIASIKQIGSSVLSFMEGITPESEVAAIGVCTPGNLDMKRGFIYHAVNLGWVDTPLKALLEEQLKLPVTIASDVVAGAYGEYRFGSARGKSPFLYISIGTGIGGSYFINGGFLTTANESVLNLGHISIVAEGLDCGCGNRGCLEQYVSSLAILRKVNRGRSSAATMLNDAFHPGEEVSLKDIYQAACSGDDYCRSVLLEAGTYLGVGIVNMVNLFGPGTIVIGGGASNLERFLLERAKAVVSERLKSYFLDKTEILRASHPGEAGVLGAASAALEKTVNI